MESPASLADITEVLEILVGQGASLANLEMCLPLLGLRQVEEGSPSGMPSDLAVTARKVLIDEIAAIDGPEARALMNLLALKPGTEELRPGMRKQAASEEADLSYEEMRRTRWKVLIVKLARQLYEGDYAIRVSEARPAMIRSAIGLGTDSIQRSLGKVLHDLEVHFELSSEARTNLLLPQPNIVAKIEFSLELSFSWARLEKHLRSVEKQCHRAVRVSEDLQQVLSNIGDLRALCPLSEADRSMLRVVYKKKPNREFHTFASTLNSDAVRLLVIDAAWTGWLSCPMAGKDPCDCPLHSWNEAAIRMRELTERGQTQTHS